MSARVRFVAAWTCGALLSASAIVGCDGCGSGGGSRAGITESADETAAPHSTEDATESTAAPTLALTIRPPDVRGAIPAADVSRALEGARADLEPCVGEASAEGFVRIRIVVAEGGAVTSASTMASEAPAATGLCLLSVVRATQFPAPASGVALVTQEFAWSPE